MELGKDMDDSVIEEKIQAKKPDQCALLIYTVSALATQHGYKINNSLLCFCSLAQLEIY